ncbi:SOS response-associated peptidase family protein [Mesorhizobium sp.]|uniref:SOS response-associated peptidase family protein n=1 Tax=Mesorhizobium sp. TaxID=1871066 RepID=UPI003BAD8B94
MFNSRIEGIDTAPAFRDAFKSKRCLIPSGRLYERTVSPADEPGHAPFSFAARWAYNSHLDITNCAIITVPAGAIKSQLHDRQPVILDAAYLMSGWTRRRRRMV